MRRLARLRWTALPTCTILQVSNVMSAPFALWNVMEPPLALVKVTAVPDKRAEIMQISDIFRGKIIDVNPFLLDLLDRSYEAGVRNVLCTDVTKDGTLEGPNLDETAALAEAITAKDNPYFARNFANQFLKKLYLEVYRLLKEFDKTTSMIEMN